MCEYVVCGRRREAEEAEAADADGSTEPKARTPHKDVGKKMVPRSVRAQFTVIVGLLPVIV